MTRDLIVIVVPGVGLLTDLTFPVLKITGCPRQLKRRSGNQILGKIKDRLPEKNSPDNPRKNRSTCITVCLTE